MPTGSKGAKHVGFKAASKKIQQGVSKESADAILAAGARNASAAAKAKNSHLRRVGN